MFIRFNVFGLPLCVQRKEGEWLLFRDSLTGIKTRIYDVVIPSELAQDELPRYLADIYHEYALGVKNEVVRL